MFSQVDGKSRLEQQDPLLREYLRDLTKELLALDAPNRSVSLAPLDGMTIRVKRRRLLFVAWALIISSVWRFLGWSIGVSIELASWTSNDSWHK